jgi:hypothetical protein
MQPKVLFKNEKEWKQITEKAFQYIREKIDNMLEDEHEYKYMESFGITPNQHYILGKIIEESLNIITKNEHKEWSSYVSHIIYTGIVCFIKSLKDFNLWKEIYRKNTKKELSKFICNIIIKQLDGSSDPYILDEVPIFTCTKCNKEKFSINDDDMCIDCEDKYT